MSNMYCLHARLMTIVGLCTIALCGWADEPKPTFLISSTALGPEGGSMAAAAFVKAVEKTGWCSAQVAPKTPDWNVVSQSPAEGTRVSIVTAGFGEQAHAFAFVAGPEGKGFSHVAHIPYRKTWFPNNSLVWVPPTAPLAAAFRDLWERRGEGTARPTVNLNVMRESDEIAAADSLLDSLLGGEPPVDSSMLHTQAAQTSMPALTAIAQAAALQAGWQPDTAATTKLTLAARFGFQSCSFLYTGPGDAKRSFSQPAIPWELYQATLVRTLRALHTDSGIITVMRLGDTTAPRAATEGRISLASGGELNVTPPTTAALRDDTIYRYDAESESLCATDTDGKTEHWRQPLGDVPLAPPVTCHNNLFIATKGNRLLLLDPTDGKIRADVLWPTWLRNASVMNLDTTTHIVCYDLRNRVAFLNSNDLRTERIVPLHEKLVGPPLYAPRLEPPQKTAAVLVCDENGFCHALAVPESAGKDIR